MKRHGTNSGISIGSSSLILIFVVLCMTVFSVLTLISANAEKKLSDKSAQAVSDYYNADLAATMKINEIAEALSSSDSAAAQQLIIPDAEFTAAEDGIIVSFDTEIDSRRTLHTEALLTENSLKITEWKTVTKTEAAEDSPGLWDGTFDFAD